MHVSQVGSASAGADFPPDFGNCKQLDPRGVSQCVNLKVCNLQGQVVSVSNLNNNPLTAPNGSMWLWFNATANIKVISGGGGWLRVITWASVQDGELGCSAANMGKGYLAHEFPLSTGFSNYDKKILVPAPFNQGVSVCIGTQRKLSFAITGGWWVLHQYIYPDGAQL